MGKSARFIGFALTLIVPMAGCATSWSGKQTGQEVGKSETNPPVQMKTIPPSVRHASESEGAQQVMAELQQVGATDPAAQHKLMADLQQADPSIWPLVMQQFRAEQAYRHRASRPASGVAGGTGILPAGPPGGPPYPAVQMPPQMPYQMLPSGSCAQRPSFNMRMPNSPTLGAPNAGAGQYPPGIAPANFLPWDLQPGAFPPRESIPSEFERPPSADASRLTPAADPQPGPAKCPSQQPAACPLAGKVVSASFEKKADPDERHLDAAASTMESGASKTPDPAQRAPAAKQVPTSGLVKAAPLEIRHLAFCTEIQSYGCITPFEKQEFEPGQEVLLYTEIENFTSEQTPRGYHTALRSSYQIFDSKKQCVADRDCPKTEEYCKNPRRDFFIGYHLVLPKEIDPGEHTLQLTIEDLKNRKIGQASIDLTIKEPAKDSPAKDGKLVKK